MMAAPQGSSNWGACFLDHYERHLRAPASRESFRQSEASARIQILGYDGVFAQCRVFASLGLSHYFEEVGEIAEVVLPVDGNWDRSPRLLANALFLLVQKRMKIGWGISVNLQKIEPDLERFFGKSSLYVTNPTGFPETFGQVSCADAIGRIYMAMFISRTEHEFFVKYGAARFEEVMEARDVDPFCIRRPSCI
jgi:suppressor of fused protein SUFU